MNKPIKKLRVIGVDPGTATVGWAVMDETGGNVALVAFGKISTSPKKSDSARLFEISDDLSQLIEKYRPDEAAVESLFFFKNQKTVMEVSQSRGAILLTISQKGLKIASYTPLQIKQSLTGYGRAEKKQIQAMTKSILGLSAIPQPDDAADAIAIAICHLHSKKILNLNKTYGK